MLCTQRRRRPVGSRIQWKIILTSLQTLLCQRQLQFKKSSLKKLKKLIQKCIEFIKKLQRRKFGQYINWNFLFLKRKKKIIWIWYVVLYVGTIALTLNCFIFFILKLYYLWFGLFLNKYEELSSLYMQFLQAFKSAARQWTSKYFKDFIHRSNLNYTLESPYS